MSTIQSRLEAVYQHIRMAASAHGRSPEELQLLAVSKTRPAEDIRSAMAAGQRRFGESYLQEALAKIDELSGVDIEWHFIGRIQGNKTRHIAEHFDWVHSLGSLKYARRLSEQRPEGLSPLNVCLQINLSGEESKGGVPPEAAEEMVSAIAGLPRLHLRGLMTLPAPADTLEARRKPFRALRELRDRLATPELPLDTLSMGMTDDLEAAVAEGATIVRIGTAIFGPREKKAAG